MFAECVFPERAVGPKQWGTVGNSGEYSEKEIKNLLEDYVEKSYIPCLRGKNVSKMEQHLPGLTVKGTTSRPPDLAALVRQEEMVKSQMSTLFSLKLRTILGTISKAHLINLVAILHFCCTGGEYVLPEMSQRSFGFTLCGPKCPQYR